MSKAASFPLNYKTRIRILAHLPGMRYIEVPGAIVTKAGGGFRIRLLCTLNGLMTFQCGIVALGNGSGYISLNQKRMKALKLKDGDMVQVSLNPDSSRYGMEVPEELKELFRQDKEGKKRFDLLSPGKRRYILFYIGSVKSEQKRIERSILIIENIKKLPVGKESFRGMLGID
jgi:hypothetical protein